MWFHILLYAIEFHRTLFNRDSFTGIKCLVRQFKFILVFSPFIHIPSTGILAFSLIFLSLSSSFPSLLSSSSTWHRIPSNQSLFTGIKCLVRQFNFILVFSPFIQIPSTGILAFSLIFLSLSSSFPSLLSSSSTWHRIPSNQSPFTGIYSCIRSTNHLLPLLLSSHSNFFYYNQLSSSFHHLCLFCVSSFPFLFLLLFLCSTNQLLILNDDASCYLFFSIEWWRTLIHQ